MTLCRLSIYYAICHCAIIFLVFMAYNCAQYLSFSYGILVIFILPSSYFGLLKIATVRLFRYFIKLQDVLPDEIERERIIQRTSIVSNSIEAGVLSLMAIPFLLLPRSHPISSFFGLSGFVDFMDVLFIIIIIAITIARILTFDMPTKIIRNAIDTICK